MEAISAQYNLISPTSSFNPGKDSPGQQALFPADSKERRVKSTEQVDTVSISPEAASKANSEKTKKETDKLKQNEEKVKTHEAAHKAAGGQYAGSVSYEYQSGPDGRSYVVGGEVQIDLSSGSTPDETISKMQVVMRAALAPSDPSGQDRAVAAQAASIMAQAQQEKAKSCSPEGDGLKINTENAATNLPKGDSHPLINQANGPVSTSKSSGTGLEKIPSQKSQSISVYA